MPDSQYGEGGGRLLLRRFIPLAGAMLASVALLAATASSASAEPVGFFISGSKSEEVSKQPKFEAEKYTTSFKSKNLTGFQFVATPGKVKCSELNFSGTLSAASSELKPVQFFTACTWLGMATLIHDNGCQFRLHVLNAGPPYVGTSDIVCPAGKALQFILSSEGVPYCTLNLLPQTGIPGVSYENTGAGSARAVTVTFTQTTVKYSQEGGIPGACPAGEFTNGALNASMSLSATK
jgi:hypothetical protein